MTTRYAFKIEDPSRGPGRVDFTAPDEEFGFEGTPKPKIQRDPSPPTKETLYVVRRCAAGAESTIPDEIGRDWKSLLLGVSVRALRVDLPA